MTKFHLLNVDAAATTFFKGSEASCHQVADHSPIYPTPIAFHTAMGSIARHMSSRATSLPDFLVPAFARPVQHRAFTSSAQCKSRIGAAPLSIPPEVQVTVLEPKNSRRNVRLRREAPPRTCEVKGPLGYFLMHCFQTSSNIPAGSMTLDIPSYMTLDHNSEARKATLSIEDRDVRQQREMWGELAFPYPYQNNV